MARSRRIDDGKHSLRRTLRPPLAAGNSEGIGIEKAAPGGTGAAKRWG